MLTEVALGHMGKAWVDEEVLGGPGLARASRHTYRPQAWMVRRRQIPRLARNEKILG